MQTLSRVDNASNHLYTTGEITPNDLDTPHAHKKDIEKNILKKQTSPKLSNVCVQKLLRLRLRVYVCPCSTNNSHPF